MKYNGIGSEVEVGSKFLLAAVWKNAESLRRKERREFARVCELKWVRLDLN